MFIRNKIIVRILTVEDFNYELINLCEMGVWFADSGMAGHNKFDNLLMRFGIDKHQ